MREVALNRALADTGWEAVGVLVDTTADLHLADVAAWRLTPRQTATLFDHVIDDLIEKPPGV